MQFTQKNRLPHRVLLRYIPAAPHKTGAGFRSLLTTQAHNRASGFFVRTVLPRLFRTEIMAGRTGPTSVGPGSCVAGTANLVRLATHSFAALDGEFSQLTTQEATPWQTANSSANTLRVVTSRLKSTADFSAQHASRTSCTSICCMSAATSFQTSILPPFSAIWRMTYMSCSSSSNNKTQPTNTSNRPFLHFAAGGLCTSVAWRI